MTLSNQYVPGYRVTPSEVIADYLDAYGETLATLVAKGALSVSAAYYLALGEVPITPEIADELAGVLGRPAHFWLRLNNN